MSGPFKIIFEYSRYRSIVRLTCRNPRRISNGSSPLDVRQEPTALHFFDILNWMLQYMPVLPEERGVAQERLRSIGVKPAHQFEVPTKITREALVQGMQARLADDAGGARESALIG